MAVPLIEETRFRSIVGLARANFDPKLFEAEARIIEHSVSSVYREPLDDSHTKPNVRPSFLRWLATDPEAARFIDPKGIRVLSVTIPGQLDLNACNVPHQLIFHKCVFMEDLCLARAEVRMLGIADGEITKGILANGITVHGPILLRNLSIRGATQLIGAQIEGNLELRGTSLLSEREGLILDGAQIRGSAFLDCGFRSSGEVRLLNARIGGDLGFDSARLSGVGRALSMDKVTVEGNLSLSHGFESSGSVGASGSRIRGDFDCSGAHLNGADIALNLATATIGGHLYLRDGFESKGRLCLHSAQIGNSIACSGAILTHVAVAITLEEATVEGTISLCEGFCSSGWVNLLGANIGGGLVCDDATLEALYCVNMKLEGDLTWTGIHNPQKTSLCLNGASIGNLRDERESWPGPGKLLVDGLIYKELILQQPRTQANRQTNRYGKESEVKAFDRIEWLNLQPETDITEPQPWMQLAHLLEAKGDNSGSKRVVFEMRRHRAKPSGPVSRWMQVRFARLEQAPHRIAWYMLFLVLFGACVFKYAELKGAMAPTEKDAYITWSQGEEYTTAYPRFNPVIYALENDLPLIRLGQDDKWAPDANYRPSALIKFLSWLRWFLIVAGWVQATILVSAIGSRFKT